MICGILGVFTCITAIPAIILGHISLSEIKKSPVPMDGAGQAKAGLGLGYGVTALYAVIMMVAMLAGMAAPLVIRQREKADQIECINHMRQIGLGLLEFHTEFDEKYPADIMELKSSGVVPNLDQLLTVRGKGQWTYFPNQVNNAEPLLVSPEIGQKKAVLYPDMAVMLKSVADAETEIHSSSTPGVKFWTPRKAPVSK